MGRKGLAILVVLTVLAGLAAWGLRARSQPAAAALPERFFPDLSARLNDVTAVSVKTHDEHFTLSQRSGTWGADEKAGHPVHFDKLKTLLLNLADLRPIERKTASPALHSKLGLAPPEAEGGAVVEITAVGADGATLADLIVGNPGAAPRTRYVRKGGDDQTWLVQGDLSPETMLSLWIDAEVMRLDANTVSHVTVTHPDGEVLNLSKAAKDDPLWTIEGLPEGSEPKNAGSASSVTGALQWLDFDDVASASEHPLPEGDRAVSVFETWDGLRVTVTAARDAPPAAPPDESAESDEAATPANPPPASEPTDWIALTVAADASAGDEVRDKAAKLNARLAPWVYKVSKYVASTLRPRMSDLTQPKAPEPPPPSEVPPADAPPAEIPAEIPADSGG